MAPRVDPENWRASHERPASRSNRTPPTMPIARTRRNVTAGSVVRMDQPPAWRKTATVLYAGSLAARRLDACSAMREPRKGDLPRLSVAQSFYVICGVIRSLGAQASLRLFRDSDTAPPRRAPLLALFDRGRLVCEV